MRVKLGFDKKRDIREVSQTGFVDLANAYHNGVVPSSASQSDLQFGNIDSPSNIYGRPHDAFEAMRMNREFKNAVKSESIVVEPSATPSE